MKKINTNTNGMLNINLTAYAPTQFQLSQLRGLLIHLDEDGEISVDHDSQLAAEATGDIAPLTFEAKIPADTYATIVDIAKYNNIALKGKINGKPVVDGEAENPILDTDADVAKARAVAEKKRAVYKAAAAEMLELQAKEKAIVDKIQALSLSELDGVEVDDSEYEALKAERREMAPALESVSASYYKARDAFQRADEKLAHCIRNKTSLYLESVA